MKTKLLVFVGVIFIIAVGTYAYTWVVSGLTIGVTEPTGDIANVNVSGNQPNWASVTGNLTENTTCGDVPSGDLFEITAHTNYSGSLQVRVYLTNADSLLKAYDYLNMELYLEGSEEAGETPNYRALTLENGMVTFNLVGITGGSYTLSVTGGTYQLRSREPMEWEAGYTVTPELYSKATQR